MIIRAPVVVTMNCAPIIDGAVRIDGDRIAQVGRISEFTATPDETGIVELDDHVLLPGLINAHCHLDYTDLRGKIRPQKSFTDWIRAINAEKARLSADDYVRSINDGFAEALRFGTTSIVNLTAFPELIARVCPPIRTWWFAELINIRDARAPQRLVEEALRSLPKSCEGVGLAPHAPYTASPELYRCCEEAAERENVLLTTHLAESKDEMRMCFDLGGPLADFLAAISPDLFEYSGKTPVETLSRFCRLDRRWLLVHVNEILDRDINLLSQTHIVHCPRSHEYFGHRPFELKKLKGCEANICLGTDSLASNDDLSLFAEMRQLQKTEPWLSASEILEMITANAALALGRASDLGRIAPGYLADMIALPIRGSAHVYEQIIALDGGVSWVMIGGKIL